MKGLRVERTFRGRICRTVDPQTAEECRQEGGLVITDRVPDFFRYFAPVLEKTAQYQWLIKGEIVYRFPDECQDEKVAARRNAWLEEFGSDILVWQDGPAPYIFTKPGFMAKYGQFILDSWLEIVGFRTPPANIQGYCREFSGITDCKKANDFLDATTDICFFCVDGASWEAFSRDESLLSVIREHMKDKAGFRTVELDLSDKKV